MASQFNQTIVNESGVELLCGYDLEKEDTYEAEPGNPDTLVKGMALLTLNSVEVVISGKGIDITDLLTQKQTEHIVHVLNINHEDN